MGNYTDRQATPPERVTSPTWGSPTSAGCMSGIPLPSLTGSPLAYPESLNRCTFGRAYAAVITSYQQKKGKNNEQTACLSMKSLRQLNSL